MNEIPEPASGKLVPATSGPPLETPPPPKRDAARKPEKQKRGGGVGSTLFSLLMYGLIGGAGYYAWTNPNPAIVRDLAVTRRQTQDALSQAGAAAQQAASLGQQIQALSDRVDKLEKAPAPAAPAAAPDLGDLPKRVDDLSARVEALANRPVPTGSGAAPADGGGASQQALADLSQRVSQAFDAEKAAVQALGARIDQIDPRLATLEQGAGKINGIAANTARVTRVEAALVALQTGVPLGNIEGAPPALARFATVAPPTEQKLRETFPALAEHAREVSLPDLSGRSFWERAMTRLQTAVTVRTGSDVLIGDPAAGILSDASDRVQLGDLAGAVVVLRQLTGPAAAVMHDWVEDASALVAARAALADMAAHG